MVFPSSVSSRRAMADRVMGGGVPFGLTATILRSAATLLCLVFLCCPDSVPDPARSPGEAPSNDRSFRLFSFMDASCLRFCGHPATGAHPLQLSQHRRPTRYGV